MVTVLQCPKWEKMTKDSDVMMFHLAEKNPEVHINQQYGNTRNPSVQMNSHKKQPGLCIPIKNVQSITEMMVLYPSC